MFNTFEEARENALSVINNCYNGRKMGCCITESKSTQNSDIIYFGYRFYSTDSNGEFLPNCDGTYSKLTSL